MKSNLVVWVALSWLMACFSCSDDLSTEELFPEGTAALYMMDEWHGKTLLGNSDVYITSERNFRSNRFPIFDMGKKSGIGDIEMPDFINMASQVAVQPGNGYVICDVDDILEFEESGQLAIAESASVYRVFVDSWIQRGDSITGANVRFLLGKPSEGQLPVWGSSLGTIWLDPYLSSIDEQTPLVVDLPSSHPEDMEIVLLGKAQDELTYTVEGTQLKLRAASFGCVDSEYPLIIRYKHVYTEVSVWVKWKNS